MEYSTSLDGYNRVITSECLKSGRDFSDWRLVCQCAEIDHREEMAFAGLRAANERGLRGEDCDKYFAAMVDVKAMKYFFEIEKGIEVALGTALVIETGETIYMRKNFQNQWDEGGVCRGLPA